MIERMVELVWQKEIFASASFTEIYFWTETTKGYLVDSQDANESDLLDLRFWLEGV